MPTSTYQLVLFDFGGVIAEEGFHNGLSAIARMNGLEPARILGLAVDLAFDQGYALGKMTESAFWNTFREKTGITDGDSALRQEVLSRFRVRPQMMKLVSDVRKMGLAVGMLSDQTNWLEELDTGQHFLDSFDMIFNSYDHGMSKREDAFFHMALETLGHAAEDTVFIDDAEHNTRRAERLGLKAILFRDADSCTQELMKLLKQTAATRTR